MDSNSWQSMKCRRKAWMLSVPNSTEQEPEADWEVENDASGSPAPLGSAMPDTLSARQPCQARPANLGRPFLPAANRSLLPANRLSSPGQTGAIARKPAPPGKAPEPAIPGTGLPRQDVGRPRG